MGVSKVQIVRNGQPETLIDLTSDTVDAAHLLQGYTAHDASGASVAGTAQIPSFVTYYTSTSSPTSSQGEDGDIWLVTE